MPFRALLVLALFFTAGCGSDPAPEPASGGTHTYDVDKGEAKDLASGGGTSIEESDTAPEAPRVSAPEAAPPVAPPPASGDIVDRDDHVDFALDFLGRQAFNSVPGFMELYADRVRYFDQGTVSRAQVATDKGNYFERWPNRYYEIDGPVRATRGTNPVIRFDYEFAVSHADASGERSGRAWVELGLAPLSDGYSYVITSERGGTY